MLTQLVDQHVCDDLLQQLVIDFPAGSSIVLISRKALPFETHSLELENRFVRLGPEALEFSRSETFEFFRPATSNSGLTSVAVDNLYDMTEGWATPLALYRREVFQNVERKPIQETPSVPSLSCVPMSSSWRLTPSCLKRVSFLPRPLRGGCR